MKNDRLAQAMKQKAEQQNADAPVNQPTGLTRRELLEAGLISLTARVLVPGPFLTLLGLSQNSMAAEASPMMPFVTVSLSGGAALHGNYVVKNAGGDLLSAYTKLGLGNRGFGIQRVMGADFASTASLHKGILEKASAAALARARLVAICTDTANDTAGNAATRPFYDLSGPLERAGLVGKMLPTTHMGSNLENLRAAFNSPQTILNISSIDSMTGALTYSNALGASGSLSTTQKNNLSRFVGRMTQSQMNKLERTPSAVKDVLEQTGIRAESLIQAGASAGIDPRLNQHAASIYGISSATAANNANAVTAAIVMNSLNGNLSHGRLTLGGYDYHLPGIRSAADVKDVQAGNQIGSMLELAHRMQKPLFIFVTTDGACVAAESTGSSSNWSSDYSSSVQFIIAYDPQGKISSSGQQIGHYLPDQSVDNTTLVGSRPDYVAAAILANYLNINKRLDLFKTLAPATLQSDDVEAVMKLHKAG